MLHLLFLWSCSETTNPTSTIEETAPEEISSIETVGFSLFHVQQLVWRVPEEFTEYYEKIGGQPQDVDISLAEYSERVFWYRYDKKPLLSPVGYELNDGEDLQSAKIVLASRLKAQKKHPKVYGHTPQYQKTHTGLFTNHPDIQVFAISSSNDLEGTKEFFSRLKESNEETTFSYLPGDLLYFPSEKYRTDIQSEVLPFTETLFLHVICWGGYENGEWPSPKRSDLVTNLSTTWGPELKPKSKKDNTTGQHPQEDLKNNRCELFASTVGVEFIKDKDKLKESKFYRLAELTEQNSPDNKRALVSSLLEKNQEDFRTTGVKRRTENLEETENSEVQYQWNLSMLGTQNAIISGGAEANEASSTTEESSPNGDPVTDAEGDKKADSASEGGEQENCDCIEQEKTRDSSIPKCSDFGSKSDLATQYREVVERTEAWTKLHKIPFKWNKKKEYFEIKSKKENSNVEVCTKMGVIIRAFVKTAQCRPTVRKTKNCWNDIDNFVVAFE